MLKALPQVKDLSFVVVFPISPHASEFILAVFIYLLMLASTHQSPFVLDIDGEMPIYWSSIID